MSIKLNYSEHRYDVSSGKSIHSLQNDNDLDEELLLQARPQKIIWISDSGNSDKENYLPAQSVEAS